MTHAIRLLGIDPGLRRTGWGMIEAAGNRLSFIASGTVTSDNKKSLAERLVELHDGLTAVVRQHNPEEAAVEHTFVNKDAGATLKLGQARGVALLVPSLAGLSVAEYAPNLVKKTVVGTGHAEKEQIRAMVKVLMPRATFNSDDAADALAIAVCHAQHRATTAAQLKARGGSMIGKLKGTIDSYGEDHVILDVHGVGYQVHCPSRILQALPRAGEAAVLFIETIVREDMIRLYGFAAEAEREWFRILMTVQGVGAKVALGILGILKASEVANAIALGDKATISRAPGVGKRVAERILSELKDKAPGLASIDQDTIAVSQTVADNVAARPVAEAVSALTNLGYGQPQASAAVAKAMQSAGEDATTETLIRLGLKELAG